MSLGSVAGLHARVATKCEATFVIGGSITLHAVFKLVLLYYHFIVVLEYEGLWA